MTPQPCRKSDTRDVSFYAYAPGSPMPPATGSGGITSRFTYVPALKGVVMPPTRDAGLRFLRTAKGP